MSNYCFYNFRMGPMDFPAGYTLMDTVPDDMKDFIHPHWSKFPPVDPLWHVLLGFVYVILGITSVTGEFLRLKKKLDS